MGWNHQLVLTWIIWSFYRLQSCIVWCSPPHRQRWRTSIRSCPCCSARAVVHSADREGPKKKREGMATMDGTMKTNNEKKSSQSQCFWNWTWNIGVKVPQRMGSKMVLQVPGFRVLVFLLPHELSMELTLLMCHFFGKPVRTLGRF